MTYTDTREPSERRDGERVVTVDDVANAARREGYAAGRAEVLEAVRAERAGWRSDEDRARRDGDRTLWKRCESGIAACNNILSRFPTPEATREEES
jgi:hypothetical protein